MNLSTATRVLEAQFPNLAPLRLELMAGGDDFHVWLVNGKWIFRFPRRGSIERKLEWERLLLPALASSLKAVPIRTPDYEKVGIRSQQFRFFFVGYRLIPGVSADSISRKSLDKHQLPRLLGRTIGRMHSMDSKMVAAAGVPKDRRTPRQLLARVQIRTHEILPILPPALLRSTKDYLYGAVETPQRYSGPARLIHNDLCPDHLLIDPATGRLIGLIDFSDAALGDPAIDFAPLYDCRGWDLILEVSSWYDESCDPQFELRVRSFARILSPEWLADAARKGHKPDILKYLRCVQRAFQQSA